MGYKGIYSIPGRTLAYGAGLAAVGAKKIFKGRRKRRAYRGLRGRKSTVSRINKKTGGMMTLTTRTVDVVMAGDGSNPGMLYLYNQASGAQSVPPLNYNGGNSFTGVPAYNGSGNTYNFTGAMGFRLSDTLLNGATVTGLTGSNFASNFDRYKLCGVAWKCTLLQNQFSLAGQQGSDNIFMPSLYYRYDYDSANAPASLQQLKNDMGTRWRKFSVGRGSTISGFLKPKFQTAVQDGTGTSLVAGKLDRGFIDVTDNNVPHFGMKWCLADVYASTTATATFRWEFKYYVKLKDLQQN